MQTDPVLLEILATTLVSVTDEIGLTIKRIAHSLYIREADDFTAALVTLDGKVFAYPQRVGVSIFVDQDCGPTIRAIPDVEPGDVIVTNHPYISEGMSTHLPDLNFLVPYFHEGRLLCYGWLFAHFSDIGGKVPGSISPSNTDLFQEGLQIPPMKICRRGEFVPEVMSFILSNVRTPKSNLGDIRALIVASRMAQRRITEIVDRYGVDTFINVQHDLIEYSAMRARNVLRRIPDGTYTFWDYMDDDFLSNIPLRIKLTMTVADGEIELDFTGTDPQTPAAYNIPTCGKRNYFLTTRIMAFVITYDPTIPRNSGMFDSVRQVAPKGTILNPAFPAATGLRAAPASRVGDIVYGALQQAVPQMVPAAPSGTAIPIVFSEPSGDHGGRRVLIAQYCNGGTGGRYGVDGVDGRGSSAGNMSNNPIETVEDTASLVVEDYALRPDSAGPGRWRGGVGTSITFRALREGCQVLARNSDHFRFAPWGVAGGRNSVHTRTILNRGRPDERDVGKIDVLDLREGDTVTVETPGGGGYGDPFERDPSAVLSDVRRGLVSVDAARRDYGVVVTGSSVDAEATQGLRSRREDRSGVVFDFDRQRIAWEEICNDEIMHRIDQILSEIEEVRRSSIKTDIFLEAFPELSQRGASWQDVTSNPAVRRRKLEDCLSRMESRFPRKTRTDPQETEHEGN